MTFGSSAPPATKTEIRVTVIWGFVQEMTLRRRHQRIIQHLQAHFLRKKRCVLLVPSSA